jgi:hypothetical protein
MGWFEVIVLFWLGFLTVAVVLLRSDIAMVGRRADGTLNLIQKIVEAL